METFNVDEDRDWKSLRLMVNTNYKNGIIYVRRETSDFTKERKDTTDKLIIDRNNIPSENGRLLINCEEFDTGDIHIGIYMYILRIYIYTCLRLKLQIYIQLYTENICFR